jgi:hypothetical protein
MKKILHSGQFLDYDGNTIKITFYQEKHLWVSTTSITAPYTGGEYEVEVWSDVGDALIYDSAYDWISDPIFKGSYTNSEGHRVYKYKIQITGRDFVGVSTTGTLNVGVEINDYGQLEGYDREQLNKTITITRK